MALGYDHWEMKIKKERGHNSDSKNSNRQQKLALGDEKWAIMRDNNVYCE